MSDENRIRDVRKGQGMTLEKLAELTGLSVTYLGRIERGDRNLSVKHMKTIATALNTTSAELLPLATTHHRIPLQGEVQAGLWRHAEHSDLEAEYFDIPLPEAYKSLRPYALRVKGPSMNKRFPEGTILICCHLEDLHEEELIPGKRYIIYDIDEADGIEMTVKEIEFDEKGRPWAWPRSTHPDYQQPCALDDGRPGHTIVVKARVIFALTRE